MALINIGTPEAARPVGLSKVFELLAIEEGHQIRARNDNDPDLAREHREKQKELSSVLLNHSELISAPDRINDIMLHLAMKRMEAVHPLPGVLKFRKFKRERIGAMGLTGDSQLLCARGAFGSRRILCEIFRHHASVKKDPEGKVYLDALHGDLDWMKSSVPKPLSGDEDATYYYSISNDPLVLMAGWKLISGLSEITDKKQFETTLSPMRTMEVDHNLPWHIKVQQVLEHIKSGQNSVAKFHLRNGAFVGWIHFNPDSPEDKITINYIYDRDQLLQNQAVMANREILVSEALLDTLSNESSRTPNFDRLRPAVSERVSKQTFQFAA